MKILAVLVLLPIVALCQPQGNDQEISLGVGKISGFDIESSWHFMSRIESVNYEYAVWPVYALNYKFYLNGNTALGLGFSRHVIAVSRIDNYARRRDETTYNILTGSLELQIRYGTKRKYFTKYATFAIGFAKFLNNGINGADRQSTYVSPIGIRLGKTHAFYAEIGLGYKGLLNGGYSLRITSKKHRNRRWHFTIS